jgi:hypothetical protein
MLYIVKGHCPLSIIEDALGFTNHFVLRQCGKVVFLSKH